MVELLAPRAGERILDLGCGDGALTKKLVEMGCEVVAVDASAQQIDAAKQLGLEAQVMDGENLRFENEFDAVFSNAALHWMRDNPDKVIFGVHSALKPGGRFVAEMGGYGCVNKIKSALVAALNRRGVDGEGASPWYFPTIEDYSERLTRGGFAPTYIALINRPTPLPGDVTAWLETFAENFTKPLPPADRPAFLKEVQENLRPHLCDDAGKWTADYVRLRFAAVKV